MKIVGRVDGNRKMVAKGDRFEAVVVQVTPLEARYLRRHNDWINASLYVGAVPHEKLLDGELGRYGNCICVVDLTETRNNDETEKVFFDELKEALDAMKDKDE